MFWTCLITGVLHPLCMQTTHAARRTTEPVLTLRRRGRLPQTHTGSGSRWTRAPSATSPESSFAGDISTTSLLNRSRCNTLGTTVNSIGLKEALSILAHTTCMTRFLSRSRLPCARDTFESSLGPGMVICRCAARCCYLQKALWTCPITGAPHLLRGTTMHSALVTTEAALTLCRGGARDTTVTGSGSR